MLGSSYKLSIIFAATLVLSACGSSSSQPAVQNTAYAYNGYLINSTVVCDSNNNGLLDTGEQQTRTDVNGHFSFATACNDNLFVQGGLVRAPSQSGQAARAANSSNYPLFDILHAPAGSKMISPLTHAAWQYIDWQFTTNTVIVSADDAAKKLQKLFDIGSNIYTTDAIRLAQIGQMDLLNKSVFIQRLVTMLRTADYTAAVKTCLLTVGNTPSFCQTSNNTVPTLSQSAAWLDLVQRLSLVASPLFVGIYSQVSAVQSFMQIPTGGDIFIYAGLFNGITDTIRATNFDSLSTIVANENKPSDYLYLADNKIIVHNTTVNIKTNTHFLNPDIGKDVVYVNCAVQGSTLSGIYPDKIRFSVGTKGSLNSALPGQDSAIVMNLSEVTDRFGSNARQLQVMIDPIRFTNNGSTLKLTVPNTAKVYIYGRNTDGSDFNIAMQKSGQSFLSASGNVVTLDYANIITHLENNSVLNSHPDIDFTQLEQLQGAFNVTMVVKNLVLLYQDGTTLPVLTAGVQGAVDASSNQKVGAISGYGIQGRLNFIDYGVTLPNANNCVN